MNYEEWILNRAEELALQHHRVEYKYLPSNLREDIYFRAQQQYRNFCATKIDLIYGRIKEEV